MNTLRELAESFKVDGRFAGTVSVDEPMAQKTTMRVGGRAALFVQPATEDALLHAVQTLEAHRVGYFVLGGGSNVIISDNGFNGAVISTRGLRGVTLAGDATDGNIPLSAARNAAGASNGDTLTLRCGAGATWGAVTAFCRQHQLGGLEAFTGLSGTVGGAVYMNASCFGMAACDRLLSVRYLAGGAFHTYRLTDARRKTDWAYKTSPFQLPTEAQASSAAAQAKACTRGAIIVAAEFALTAGYDGQKAAQCLQSRKEKGHFAAPSAGSAFKNDSAHGVIAGRLIDECGLKGYAVGGAQIAPWHGNFIINAGGATADDIAKLVRHVTKTVQEQKGVALEPEIIFCGIANSAN